MDAPPAANPEFRRRTPPGGGATPIPRWTLAPVAGSADHEAQLPAGTAAPSPQVLLAAHAKVLAALTGEDEIVTGYVLGGRALPVRLTVGGGSWRALLHRVGEAEAGLAAHRDVPLPAPRCEPGPTGPSFETVLDPHGAPDLPDGTVLGLGIGDRDGRAVLGLRYRTDVLDAAAAARIAGYHLAALALIDTEPDAAHGRHSLLSPAEYRFQIDGLAGPARKLPDRRVHELFEQRVQAHPDAVAAVHGEQTLTYRDLNARANRLARALLARGLRREGVVAVVTERNLDWAAAVLAVFKAGGVYLPIEPQFPADRIATTIARAGCALVLTEAAGTATLDRALESLPTVQALRVEQVPEEGHADADLTIGVERGDLAYIYFTSGSTGEPKGAMCEHAGLLNHLYAKIDDLGVGPDDVVAQTAPQCFDISLWQLVCALLVGGRTVLVEQQVVLDVARYIDTLVQAKVTVLQVVPSYLEVILAYLEQHPRELPDLRCVSVTGEALKKELTERWFATKPGIPLVNAYGLTETSDDTNHEVMHGPPARDRVPLGRPVANVRVYVVDEQLRPVPLGAPGAIVFSGVCVGRGYVNDPDRTRAAFLADPHRPGERLYRAGDFGRWLPEGKLEFLGRRDGQVKIAGFRIELGEIENALLRVPGVRDGAVVVAERPDRSRHLVAFYAGRETAVQELRERLGRILPGYLIPSTFHRLQRLPLTANSKIDRRALSALAAQRNGAEDQPDAPRTPTERRLAAAWAAVLGVPVERVGRHDHFFDGGGTSLSAVKLAIGVDRAVSITDITQQPVLADLAALLDSRAGQRPEPMASS